jgi:hypothetical protein
LEALETKYKDILFRSKLEARWAIYYDSLLIPWQYEPETYKLSGGILYCPDFWLPEQKCYIEIKGEEGGFPTDNAIKKAEKLAEESKNKVYIFYGDIPDPARLYKNNSEESSLVFVDGNGYDFMHWWCKCIHCGKLDIQFEGRSGRIECCEKNKSTDENDYLNANDSIFINAYKTSRSYRFWEYKK